MDNFTLWLKTLQGDPVASQIKTELIVWLTRCDLSPFLSRFIHHSLYFLKMAAITPLIPQARLESLLSLVRCQAP